MGIELGVLPWRYSSGTTERVAATDTAASLPSTAYVSAGGRKAVALIVTVELNSIRIAFNTSPTQGASPVGHLFNDGDTFVITGYDMIREAEIINAVAQSDAVLQITPMYI